MTFDVISIIVSSIITVGSIVASLFATSAKNKKARALEILGTVADYVKQAETLFGSGNGTAKLQWVLTKVQIDCVKNNVKISDETINNEVERVLATPEKKKETTTTTTSATTTTTNNVGYAQNQISKGDEK